MRGKSKHDYYGQGRGWLPASVYPSEAGVYRVASGVWRRFDGQQWYMGARDPIAAARVAQPAKYATPWKPELVRQVKRRQPAQEPANHHAPTDLWSAIAHVQTIAEAAGYSIEIKSVKKVEGKRHSEREYQYQNDLGGGPYGVSDI